MATAATLRAPPLNFKLAFFPTQSYARAVSSDRLIIFLKAPRPGYVKTRLAALLGSSAACDAYIRLVNRLAGNLQTLPKVELRFTPDDSADEVQRWLQPGWFARPQGEGDLGERLARAFKECFAAGAQKVVVIGSDCPDVSARDIATAFEALDGNDVVLGPAEDGGYWLIALKRPAQFLFNDMPWSSPALLEQTRAAATAHHLKTRLLRTLCDIDTPEDWQRFEASQQSTLPRPR